MNYNEPKPGDVLAKWDAPVAPYRCDMTVADSVEGDNPSNYPTSISLPDQGDIRNKGGAPSSDPTPGMPGA